MTLSDDRSRELIKSIETRLRSMPYEDYLVVMSSICERLQDAYSRFLSAADEALIERTLAAIRLALREGPNPDVALPVSQAWMAHLSDPSGGPGGYYPALFTIHDVIAELSGEVSPRASLTWLSTAAKELEDRDAPDDGPRLVKLSSSSPPAGREAQQLLVDIEQITRLGSERDDLRGRAE